MSGKENKIGLILANLDVDGDLFFEGTDMMTRPGTVLDPRTTAPDNAPPVRVPVGHSKRDWFSVFCCCPVEPPPDAQRLLFKI